MANKKSHGPQMANGGKATVVTHGPQMANGGKATVVTQAAEMVSKLDLPEDDGRHCSARSNVHPQHFVGKRTVR